MTRIPDQMRAAYITELGPPGGIRVGVRPVPRPGQGEVLVRVEALSANRVDTYIRSGAIPARIDFPFVIGRDLVGEVVGEVVGVTGGRDLAVGQRVWCNSLGHNGRQGAYAEYVAVAADRLYPLPDGVDPLAAVAVLHPAAAAHLALFRHGRLRAGETVYIGGGAGNVGSAAVEFAVAAGARVITSVRFAGPDSGGPTDREYCLALGADVVLDFRAGDFGAQVAAAAGGGIDLHLDTSGRHDLDTAVRTLAMGGRIVMITGLLARPAFPVGPFYTKDGSLIGFAISNATAADLAEAAAGVNAALASGRLVPRIGQVLPFSAAAEAHRLIEAGRLLGRIVLTV